MKIKNAMTALLAMALLSGCSSNGGDTYSPTPDPTDDGSPAATENAVRLRSDAAFGSVLTDSDGMTLYLFSPDSKGDSNCTEGCIATWPVFHVGTLTVDQGLDQADFGNITRSDGAMQTTYKGWPLYYYANDAAEGDVNGDGINNIWYVAKPDYSVMMVQAQLVGRDSGGTETQLTDDYQPGEGQTFYMTDEAGNTLYSFINDKNGMNNFTSEDFSNNAVWPIFEVDLQKIPSILKAEDFGSIDVFGRQQLTYKGWPLYYFGQDTERGDNYGVGFPMAGIWPIVNPDSEVAPEEDPGSDFNAVRLRTDTTFGPILTDAAGASLYFFSLDSKGDSNCTEGCLDIWPVFHVDELTLDEGLEESDFETITRDDGAQQTTYKGWPLYYYAGDSEPDDVNGDGINAIWYVAKPDYTVMLVLSQLVGRDSGGTETNLTGEYMPGDEATPYMTDAYGNTLYRFSNDTNGANNFTNSDFSNNAIWPIYEEGLVASPTAFDPADFGSIDVFGRQQLTYKGWPLYHFGQDQQRGDNFGVGFPMAGIWPIANPDTVDAP